MSAPAIVVVGVSAGGLRALGILLSGLPATFPVPIAVVQHRAADSVLLASLLQARAKLRVCEVEDKQPLEAGVVHLAPPDYHLLVDRGHFSLTKDAPVAFSRPSIDVLFISAADALGPGVIGVVLTGANRDGARGLARVAARGGHTVVQEPASAEVPTMPEAALQLVPGATVLPLEAIADHLSRTVADLAPRGSS